MSRYIIQVMHNDKCLLTDNKSLPMFINRVSICKAHQYQIQLFTGVQKLQTDRDSGFEQVIVSCYACIEYQA